MMSSSSSFLSSDVLTIVGVVVLDVQELDVEEEVVIACAQCQRVVLLLGVFFRCNCIASSPPSSCY